MKKQTHLHLGWSECEHIFSKRSFLGWTISLIQFRFMISSHLFQFISETGEATLSFHKNGRSLGAAFQLNSSTLGGRALFPHVLCKNCSVSVNLDPESPWHASPAGFCTLLTLPPGRRTRALVPTASRSDCEVGKHVEYSYCEAVAASHDRLLHLSGADDGWFAGFW